MKGKIVLIFLKYVHNELHAQIKFCIELIATSTSGPKGLRLERYAEALQYDNTGLTWCALTGMFICNEGFA